MKKIVLTYIRLPPKAEERLRGVAELYNREEIGEEILPKVNIVIGYRVPSQDLEKMERLELFQSYAAGVDALPWKSIPEHVVVCSNAGSNSEAVAEHAWALILMLAKNLHIHLQRMREGKYVQKPPKATFLKGKIIGIIGLGHIGRRIAETAKTFEMKVYAITRSGKARVECDFVGDPSKLDYVLGVSDVVVLSSPLTKETKWMINLERLRRMKRDAILVNVGRADLIKRDDLLMFLEENPLFRVGIDVWWNVGERFEKDKVFFKYPNVVGTPWIAGGYGNEEVMDLMLERAVENVIKYIKSGVAGNRVDRMEYV